MAVGGICLTDRAEGSSEAGYNTAFQMSTLDEYRLVVVSTDPDWYGFQRAHSEFEEVNFWRPGATSTQMARGTPWLFLLRGTSEIWGCAFYSAFSVMPIGVAWDTFGLANGFDDFTQFVNKIATLTGKAGKDVANIGCAVLSAPEYFEIPIEYKPFGRMYGPLKSFDARATEGARLHRELTDRIQSSPELAPFLAGGKGKPVLVPTRLGQGAFRIELERQYETRCAITGERTRPVLDAAHIKPFKLVGQHSLPNGLLLRKDIHKLFDDGYVTVTPDRRFRVSRAIRDEFENGRDYYALDGRQIRDTLKPAARPGPDYLEWHSSVLFKG